MNIELLDSNWMETIRSRSELKFKLNGIEISDSRIKLESILHQNNVKYEVEYPLIDEVNKKIYKCAGYKFKLDGDLVVGFALTAPHIGREYIEKHFGMPDAKEPIIGQVYSFELFDIDGYIWEYEQLKLAITFNEEQSAVHSFHFGHKLYYSDNY